MSLFDQIRTAGSSRFRRNFIRVAQANLISQLILLLAAPILTRLYSPDQFGIAAYFTAAFQVCSAMATWRMDWSIPNARDTTTAIRLFLAGTGILLFFGLTSMLLLSLDSSWLSFWRGYEPLGGLLLLLPLGILGTGLHALFQGWFIRSGDLGIVGKTRVYQSVSNVSISLIAGLGNLGATGLVAGALVGTWAGIATLTSNSRDLLTELPQHNFASVCKVANEHARVATLSTVVSVVNVFSTTGALLLLSQIYPPAQVGLFALMTRLAASPINVFATALAQSFWSRAAELAREGDYLSLRHLYLRVTRLLSGVACFIALGTLAGPWYIGAVFGDEWHDAGWVLAALTPMLVGTMVFSTTNHLVVLKRQDLQLVSDGLRVFLMLLSALAALLLHFPITMAVLAIALASASGNITLFIFHLLVIRRLIERNDS